MCRAPRVLQELYETLKIISGTMTPSFTHFHDSEVTTQVNLFTELESTARATVSSIAAYDIARDKTRDQLCSALESWLGHLWRPLPPSSLAFVPAHLQSVSDVMHLTTEKLKDRRVLLFHLAALLDVNECGLEILGDTQDERETHFRLLDEALARDVIMMDSSCRLSTASLATLYGRFHAHIRETLKVRGRNEPNEALTYWQNSNTSPGLVSPFPFNNVARAFLASQASFAAAERLFSNLGRREGTQCQSLLSRTLEMFEVIRGYVENELQSAADVQNGLLHSKAASFKRIARKIDCKVWEDREEA
ncbi:hypothetical protein FGB62_35g07 [Gracilaria domingensis]|nr:hypothetical protein FGB62_35g07 [Gracilaria domingensis]